MEGERLKTGEGSKQNKVHIMKAKAGMKAGLNVSWGERCVRAQGLCEGAAGAHAMKRREWRMR